jgi:hypothetical protein
MGLASLLSVQIYNLPLRDKNKARNETGKNKTKNENCIRLT